MSVIVPRLHEFEMLVPSAKEILLSHSRYIRDDLAPVVAREGGRLSDQQTSSLNAIFASLSAVKVTVEMVQYSRMDRALTVISMEGIAWPGQYQLLAEALLMSWEQSIGPLRNIKADLWGPGGRLEGIKKLKSKDDDRDSSPRKGSSWSVATVENRFKAYTYGHLGFKVGDWWIKPAAAFRDGIIDETHNSISADDFAAYAIRLDGDQELQGRPKQMGVEGLAVHEVSDVEDATIWYLPPVGETGARKLLRAIRARHPIRVLRSSKLNSPLAPKAGLRYDGLYRVIGYTVDLDQDENGKDVWDYAFQLARQTIPPQESLERALAFPLADQMDDWKDYQRMKAEQEGGGLMNMMLLESKSSVQIPGESGYFTANPSMEVPRPEY